MYRAKSLGKSRSVVFSQTMHRLVFERLNLENDLRKALENQELELYYQPIISVNNREIAGFEALLRWQHPEKGMIPPSQFIPLAEETGLIIPIGEWIMREACLKAAMLQAFMPINFLFMSINLSPKQFTQTDLIEKVEQILQNTDCDRHLIKLELTESAILEKEDNSIPMLNKLRELGVQICIDDFGTGYSSLSRLDELPINTIKIDRCFVDAIGKNKRKEKIMRTIAALAHNLDMNVVAEGIETELQFQKLLEYQCEFAQGYLFGRPIDSNSVDKLFNL
jgi:EAL domain-containing protein (putative c-di-GMP-specific phosphodiesterase class I)